MMDGFGPMHLILLLIVLGILYVPYRLIRAAAHKLERKD